MNPIKLASTFSGGFGSINFAFKYENIEYEDIFAVELMKPQRESYVLNHGKTKLHFDIIEHSLDNYKPMIYSIDFLMKNKAYTHKGICEQNKKIQSLRKTIRAHVQKKATVFSNIFKASKYKGKIDFLHQSPSCKSFSMAGSRNGLGVDDGRLMFEAIRVIDEVQPKIFIIENVASITSSRGGEDWKEILKAIRSIPGYTISFGKMNAKHYGGIQNRDRMFIVGFRANCYPMPFPERVERKYKLADFLEDEVDEKYYLSDKMMSYLSTAERATKNYDGTQEISPAFVAGYGTKTDGFYLKDLNQVGSVGGEVAQKHNSAWARVYDTNGVAPAQVAHGGGGGAKTGLFLVKSNTKDGYEVGQDGDGISLSRPTSTTRRGRVGKGVSQSLDTSGSHGVADNHRIRKLTEREAARVMGDFDDKFNLGDFSMSKRYEFIGNAIEINTYRHLLRQILKHAEGLIWNESQEPSFAITEPKQQLNLFGE